MRIGVEARWLQGTTTGFGKYALNLLREFGRLRHEHRFSVYLDGDPQNRELFSADCVEPIVVPWRPPFYKQIGIPADILWNRRRFDLFHFLYNAPSVLTPCPFVLTLHDLSYLHVPAMVPFLNRVTVWWQLRMKVSKARLIITDSQNSKADIMTRLGVPESKIDVIPLGVESAFRPADDASKEIVRQRYGLWSPFFLYVGTYLPHKNLETLVAAFGRLATGKRRSLDLVMAGKKGRNSQNIERLVSGLGLQGRVHLLGYVPDADLPALYSLCTAFVFPSRYEGFGLPLLEAMACGAPVLAARSSCLPEVGGEAADYFNPDSVEQLSGLLERVLDDDSRRAELIRLGRVRASGFDWRSIAERTLSVYERAVRYGRRR